MPNFRHLRAFSFTARNNSVKSAAAEIFLSQPAVTQAISKLEADFGETFFERASTGMYCTAAGEVVVRRVDRALEEIARASKPDVAARTRRGNDPMRHISTSHLRAIVAIADHGSFAAAARHLGISQPSIQRTARSLEHVLGFGLFQRSHNGIGISAEGKQFARSAKLAMREIEIAHEEIELLRGRRMGRIVIGALPLARIDIVPHAVTRLLAQHPDVRIQILEGPYDDLLEGLRNGNIDVVVGALRSPAPEPDVVERELFADKLSVVVRAGHPLRAVGKITLSDTIGYPWIVPRAGTPTRRHFHDIFKSRALVEPKRVLEVSSHVSLRALLMESDRVTLISRRQIHYEEEAGTLIALPIELPETSRAIGLTLRANWASSRVQRDLLGEIEAASAQSYGPEAGIAADPLKPARRTRMGRVRAGG